VRYGDWIATETTAGEDGGRPRWGSCRGTAARWDMAQRRNAASTRAEDRRRRGGRTARTEEGVRGVVTADEGGAVVGAWAVMRCPAEGEGCAPGKTRAWVAGVQSSASGQCHSADSDAGRDRRGGRRRCRSLLPARAAAEMPWRGRAPRAVRGSGRGCAGGGGWRTSRSAGCGRSPWAARGAGSAGACRAYRPPIVPRVEPRLGAGLHDHGQPRHRPRRRTAPAGELRHGRLPLLAGHGSHRPRPRAGDDAALRRLPADGGRGVRAAGNGIVRRELHAASAPGRRLIDPARSTERGLVPSVLGLRQRQGVPRRRGWAPK
jgi:hypothetical protein